MKYIMNGRRILVGQSLWNYKYFFLWLTLIYSSCKQSPIQKIQSPESAKSVLLDQDSKQLPADFLEFYNQFHSDSIFQMEHIDFPLKGLPDNADPEDMKENDFYYTSDLWFLQKEINPKANDVSYINMANIVIEERIIEKEHKLMVIRRFAKNSGGWNLIYYAGLNKYKHL